MYGSGFWSRSSTLDVWGAMVFIFFASRHGGAQLLSEFVAAFGLMSVIWGRSRLRADATPFAVASYIVAAYWFTASTSFANPAVTIARYLSDTFAGIRPADVPGFIVAQFAGALAATFLFRWLIPVGTGTTEQSTSLLESGTAAFVRFEQNNAVKIP
jgi:glycerol uptake facilitator-like aquaporin